MQGFLGSLFFSEDKIPTISNTFFATTPNKAKQGEAAGIILSQGYGHYYYYNVHESKITQN